MFNSRLSKNSLIHPIPIAVPALLSALLPVPEAGGGCIDAGVTVRVFKFGSQRYVSRG